MLKLSVQTGNPSRLTSVSLYQVWSLSKTELIFFSCTVFILTKRASEFCPGPVKTQRALSWGGSFMIRNLTSSVGYSICPKYSEILQFLPVSSKTAPFLKSIVKLDYSSRKTPVLKTTCFQNVYKASTYKSSFLKASSTMYPKEGEGN